jgi:integration host factor subunit alpha
MKLVVKKINELCEECFKMTLTKDKIIDNVKVKSGIALHDARTFVEYILESVKAKLENGDDVKISGFGKWHVREKKSRPGRNPHTGTKIEITARKVVTFHPSEKFRDSIDKAQLRDDQVVCITRRGASK